MVWDYLSCFSWAVESGNRSYDTRRRSFNWGSGARQTTRAQPLLVLLHSQLLQNRGQQLSQGPKFQGAGARRPSLLPQGCQPTLASDQVPETRSTQKGMDLCSVQKLTAESHSHAELGKRLQERQWVLGWGCSRRQAHRTDPCVCALGGPALLKDLSNPPIPNEPDPYTVPRSCRCHPGSTERSSPTHLTSGPAS